MFLLIIVRRNKGTRKLIMVKHCPHSSTIEFSGVRILNQVQLHSDRMSVKRFVLNHARETTYLTQNHPNS